LQIFEIKSDYKTGIQTQSEIPKPLGTWSILWPVLSSSFFYSLSFIRFSPISSGKCSFRTRERTGKRNQRNSSRIPIAKPISRKDPRWRREFPGKTATSAIRNVWENI